MDDLSSSIDSESNLENADFFFLSIFYSLDSSLVGGEALLFLLEAKGDSLTSYLFGCLMISDDM